MWVELVVGSLPCSERFFFMALQLFPLQGSYRFLDPKFKTFSRLFPQNNNLFIQTGGNGYLIGDQHPAKRACFCLFLYWVRQNRASERTVFSLLNFSSASKGPFTAGKAINISLLAEVSLSFLSFLPRRERPLLAGKINMCQRHNFLLEWRTWLWPRCEI